MSDCREPSDYYIRHALLVQDLADPYGIEHQRRGGWSEACAAFWIANMTLAASTMVRTLSATVMRSCLRICATSMPRSSSTTANSCISPVYAGRSGPRQARHEASM